MEQDRRQSPRYRLRQLIHLGFGKETFIPSRGTDISTAGIGCQVDEPVDLYSRVYLMIQLGEDDSTPPIQGEGVVLRCSPREGGGYDVGIEFTEVLDFDVEKIAAFLGAAD
ncbi:PilZ domain-containing protein [Alkalispirochaeta americana]|nr:PilZ domain-containing protein [Alkalispirochaeta americana]